MSRKNTKDLNSWSEDMGNRFPKRKVNRLSELPTEHVIDVFIHLNEPKPHKTGGYERYKWRAAAKRYPKTYKRGNPGSFTDLKRGTSV
jgi:hypothetical protein